MSYSLGNPNITNAFRFKDLARIDKEERLDRETRMPSIVNTYQNEPKYQKAENLSRNYVRSGMQKFADPFPNNSRPLDWNYNGRNLHLLNSLEANRQRNFPEVITPNPLVVVGRY